MNVPGSARFSLRPLFLLTALFAADPVAIAQDAAAPGRSQGAEPSPASGADASLANQDAPAPDSEPEIPRGLRVREDGAFEGYTLISPLCSGATYLIDMAGEVVHTWSSDHAPGAAVYLLDNGHLLRCNRFGDNPVFHGGGIGGRIQERDWDGQLVWDYLLSNEERSQHHDIAPLANGNVLMIVWERMTADEAVAAGRDPERVGEEGLWPDAVLEVQPVRPDGGRIVWEWHSKDHLIQDFDQEKRGYAAIPEHPGRIDVNADHRDERPLTDDERRRRDEQEREMRALGYVGGEEEDGDGESARAGTDSDGARVGGDAAGGAIETGSDASGDGDQPPPPPDDLHRADWLHTNSIDYHSEHDLILLSVPRMNEIWVIDHSTTTKDAAGTTGGRWKRGGELLYRWGNPKTYGAGNLENQQLFSQHHAQWIPRDHPGAGNVLLFNNGRGRPKQEFSSVDELELPFDRSRGFLWTEGIAFLPERPVWSYVAPDPETFFSFFISGCQRLRNGNTLICSGAQGRIFEATDEGKIVWEYWNPYGGEIPPSFGRAHGGPPPPVDPKALFRATRIARDHPAVKNRVF